MTFGSCQDPPGKGANLVEIPDRVWDDRRQYQRGPFLWWEGNNPVMPLVHDLHFAQ